jgi:hypothetical protein
MKLPTWTYKTGLSFAVDHGLGSRRYHIRGVIDKEVAIMRRWRGPGYGWDYEAFHPAWFEVNAHAFRDFRRYNRRVATPDDVLDAIEHGLYMRAMRQPVESTIE